MRVRLAGHAARIGDMRMHTNPFGKPQRKRPCRRPICRCEEINFREMEFGGVEWIYLVLGRAMADCCEHSNESSGFVKVDFVQCCSCSITFVTLHLCPQQMSIKSIEVYLIPSN